MQRSTMEETTNTWQRMLEFPIEQTLKAQKTTAEMLRNGLEMQERAQKRGQNLTKTFFDSYIESIDKAEQKAQQGQQQMGASGQPSQGQPRQQFQAGPQPQQSSAPSRPGVVRASSQSRSPVGSNSRKG
ncbi:hypothetical protein VB779_22285 [Haloarculaceae archaeon H-GB11]|nr:hypothetical protein [Haloarculaceae archaeon H-GB11]